MPANTVKTAFGVVLMALSLGGCGWLGLGRGPVSALDQVRMVTPTSAGALSLADLHYQRAVAAIDRRAYAQAIDQLQRAKAQGENDARVLNAFGVVYDKLGRFDLSARYYAQALLIEPESPIVRRNYAYSRYLQNPDGMAFAATGTTGTTGTTGADGAAIESRQATASALPAASATAPETAVATADPTVSQSVTSQPRSSAVSALSVHPIETHAPASSASAASSIEGLLKVIATYPVEIVDMSGSSDLGAGVRRLLLSQGWEAAAVWTPRNAVQTLSTITFPADQQAAAMALTRTLPGTVLIQACVVECQGIRLVIGSNARAWAIPREIGSIHAAGTRIIG